MGYNLYRKRLCTLTVSYKNLDVKGSHYITASGGTRFETACNHKSNSMTIDTSSWADGQYSIQVYGQAVMKDAKPSMDDDDWTKNTNNKANYIQLD